MSGYEEPNYTQAPNTFFDVVMPQIDTLTEMKVTLAVIRQTKGYHRDEDMLSLSRLQELTGLSRPAVIDGIERSLKRGSIVRRKVGQSYKYRLKVVNNVNQSSAPASKQPLPEVVNNVNPQKKEKESTPTGSGKPPTSNVKHLQSAFIADLYERLRNRGLLKKRALTSAYKKQLGGEIREHLKAHQEEDVWKALDHIVFRWQEVALPLWQAMNSISGRERGAKPSSVSSSSPEIIQALETYNVDGRTDLQAYAHFARIWDFTAGGKPSEGLLRKNISPDIQEAWRIFERMQSVAKKTWRATA